MICKNGIISLIMFLLVLPVPAQYSGAEFHREKLYTYYVREEMDSWKGIIDEMEMKYHRSSNRDLLYELCFTYYGYIGFLIQQERDREAKILLDEALERSRILEKVFEGRGDILALRGALLGYKLVLSKFTAPLVGPKALKYIKRSQDYGSLYFNCNMEMGNMLYFSPRYLGGNKEKAIQYYEEAVSMLEKGPLKRDRHWLFLNTVLLLANAYVETGQKTKACRLYRQMLEYEPEATWINKDLTRHCN